MSTPQQRRRRRELAARRELLRTLYWRPARCAIQWDARCTGTATDPHELKTRARGGPIAVAGNIVAGCRPCHDAAHHHPEEAAARGFLVHSWEPTPGTDPQETTDGP